MVLIVNAIIFDISNLIHLKNILIPFVSGLGPAYIAAS